MLDDNGKPLEYGDLPPEEPVAVVNTVADDYTNINFMME